MAAYWPATGAPHVVAWIAAVADLSGWFVVVNLLPLPPLTGGLLLAAVAPGLHRLLLARASAGARDVDRHRAGRRADPDAPDRADRAVAAGRAPGAAMTGGPLPHRNRPPADPLLAPLAALARLRLIRDPATAGLAALLAGAVTALGAGLVDPQGRILPGGAVPPALALGAFALLAGGLWVWRRRPGRVGLAFDVDRRLGLGQLYGSAVDLALTPAAANGAVADGPVPRALLASAGEAAARIDPRRISLLLTRTLAALCALLALVATLLWGGWLTAAPLPAPDPIGAEAGAKAEKTRREDLETVASLIAAEAARRKDPYLAAVATALARELERDGAAPLSSAQGSRSFRPMTCPRMTPVSIW
ncbi:hypothetical protein RNZ50_24445 [Paracoccaceae bacterium Fryx2]|nr:hypothetical protein [Paracoccaceae bacterium Fryx2]